MLKQRVITALWLVPLAIWGFFFLQGRDFALFAGAIVALGAWEWARLAGWEKQLWRVGYALVTAGLTACLYWVPVLAPLVLGIGLLWWVLASGLVLSYPNNRTLWAGLQPRLLIGWLTLLPAWQALLTLKQQPAGDALILGIMGLVWSADVGAFFVGRRFGRHKLAVAVSPGKTWEGVAGGILAALLLVLLVGFWGSWSTGQLLLILLGSLPVVAISVVGDLSESMFKRNEGIKDSSQLLPGHGGVLDRIDSLTAALPMAAFLVWICGWGN